MARHSIFTFLVLALFAVLSMANPLELLTPERPVAKRINYAPLKNVIRAPQAGATSTESTEVITIQTVTETLTETAYKIKTVTHTEFVQNTITSTHTRTRPAHTYTATVTFSGTKHVRQTITITATPSSCAASSATPTHSVMKRVVPHKRAVGELPLYAREFA